MRASRKASEDCQELCSNDVSSHSCGLDVTLSGIFNQSFDFDMKDTQLSTIPDADVVISDSHIPTQGKLFHSRR